MAKAFSERPGWQKGLIVGGWAFIALVVFVIVVGESAQDTAQEAGQSAEPPDFGQVRAEFARLAGPCDAAQAGLGEGMQDLAGGDRVAMARSASRMQRACEAAWLGVDEIALPDGLSDAQESQAETMVESCKMAFFVRKQAAEKLVPVIDGDARPSTLAALQEEMVAMQRYNLDCVAAFVDLTGTADGAASAE